VSVVWLARFSPFRSEVLYVIDAATFFSFFFIPLFAVHTRCERVAFAGLAWPGLWTGLPEWAGKRQCWQADLQYPLNLASLYQVAELTWVVG
jgi:hypothetical protein